MQFIDLVVRRPGSCHDSRVFDNSSIRARLEEGLVQGILIGDSGYLSREYLLTPILRPANVAEERYNLSHIRTRNIVERAIGVWKQRFPCLRRGLGNSLGNVCAIICAVGVLHNIAIQLRLPFPEDLELEEDEVGNVFPHAPHANGLNARRLFIERHFS
jgi:hypothetical protein